jgi:hypothetical protein
MIKSFQTSGLRISPELRSFFSRHATLFSDYPNLWVKGGAAKDALLNLFTEEREGYVREPESPRDLDLVLIREDWNSEDSNLEFNKILSRFRGEVESEDFEIDRSFEYYFSTRDLGINQVLINPNYLLATDIAIRDAKRGSVSPTPYEWRGNEDSIRSVGPKVALKSLFIGIRDGLKIRESVLKSLSGVTPFWVLIFLFKADDIGLGDKFFEELKKYTSLLSDTESFEEALIKIYGLVPNFSPAEKQSASLRGAEALLSDNYLPVEEKIFKNKGWVEANLVTSTRLLKLAKALISIGLAEESCEISNLILKESSYNKPRVGKKRWSVKQKRGINCSSPKGFSQKQYCKRKARGGGYKS